MLRTLSIVLSFSDSAIKYDYIIDKIDADAVPVLVQEFKKTSNAFVNIFKEITSLLQTSLGGYSFYVDYKK